MSKRVKGITIEIEGETKGLDKALQDVNKRSRDVNSELRDVERLLKFNPGNTELLAQKQKLLGDQVETTRDRLDQLKGAQEEVERQFAEGEIGEEQYRNFQRELVETESKPAHFESQLEGTQEKTKTFAERLNEGGQRVKDVGGKISDAGGSLTKFVTGPIAAGAAGLLGLAVNAGKTADRILDLSAITGLSTDSIQEWQHVATVAGVEQEALTNAVEGLIRKIPQLESEGGKATESLDKLGLSFSELENMTPDQQVDTLIKKLSEMEDPMEANAIGSQLFGGAWKDIAPILSMGSDAIADARDEAHDLGRVLSEDSLNEANNFRIELDKLIETFKAMFVQIGAELAPLLQDTLVPLIRDQIVPAIVSFSEKVAEIIEWFTNLSPAMQGTILALIGLLAAIGPVLVIVGKLAVAIGSLMQLWATLGPVLAAISGPIGIVIGVIAGLIAIGVALYKNWDKIKEFGKATFEFLKNFITSTLDKIKNIFNTVLDWLNNVTGGKFQSIADLVKKYMTMAKDVLSSIRDFIKGTFSNTLQFLKSLVTGDFQGMKDAIKNQMDNAKNTIKNIWNSVMDFFKGIDLKQIGKDIIQGLINGVKSMAENVVNSVKGVVNGAIDGAKKLLGIKSPSRVFMEIGEFTGEGLEKGLQNMGKRVSNAGQQLADSTIPDVEQINPAAGGGAGQQMVINPAPVYLDEQLIGEIILNIVDQRLSTQFSMNSYVKGDR